MKYAMLLVAMMTLGACLEDEDEGRPQPDCGPSNCAGCCVFQSSGPVCLIGTARGACGDEGSVCENCGDIGSDWYCRSTGSYTGEPGSTMTCQPWL